MATMILFGALSVVMLFGVFSFGSSEAGKVAKVGFLIFFVWFIVCTAAYLVSRAN